MTTTIRPVRDLPQYRADTNGNVWEEQPDGALKLLKARKLKNGYLGVSVRVNGRRSLRHLHTLVAKAFLPPPPPGKVVVRHLDGNKLNPVPSNLAYGSHKDNAADQKRLGRVARGQRHPNSTLSDADARAAKLCLECGATRKAVAERFGVSVWVVGSIDRGERYVGDEVKTESPMAA